MQVHRLIEIIYILLERGKVTAEELAKRFEVSTRTIYRDIETLSMANIPVVMKKGYNGGISLVDGYTLSKAMLTDSEKMEIMSALSAVGAVEKESNNAISKLSSIFGGNNFDWIEVDFSSWYNVSATEEKFEKIKNSILSKTMLEIKYISSNGVSTKRKIAPLKLCFKSQAWYLYGFCYQKNDYRFFKLTRIHEIIITKEIHNATAPKKVLKKLEHFNEEQVDVKLKINKCEGSRVYDEFRNIAVDNDGDFIVEFTFPKSVWLRNYVLSFGNCVKVIEPQYLNKEIKEYLLKMIKNFEK